MLYPQQNDVRNVLELSGLWQFKLDPSDVGEAEAWFNGLQDSRLIAVPGSWNEQFEDTRDYLGVAWYALETFVPKSWQSERSFIRVGSANYHARVWVNGQVVGEHAGGHLPFAFDISSALNWDKPNLIAIRVENNLEPTRVPPGDLKGGFLGGFMTNYPNTSYDFFPYAGLHRPVKLFSTPKNAIEDITVITSVEAGGAGTVQVQLRQTGKVQAVARLVGEGETLEQAFQVESGAASTIFRLDKPRLWSPKDPYLYALEIELGEDGKTLDRYSLDVGIRSVEVRGKELLLNGEPIFLKDFGKHEDFPIHGRGLNLPVLVRDHSLFKWLGANSYRTAHYPYSEEAMQMADREGILIIDETPAVGIFFEDGAENIALRLKQCEQHLQELVERDKNHPSVIMWSVANEPLPPDLRLRFAGAEVPPLDPSTTDFFRTLVDLSRKLDPSRPVTLAGIHGSPVEWFELCDVVLVNRYFGWYSQQGRLDEGKRMLEAELDDLFGKLGKPMIVSEFGADTLAGFHSNPPEMFSEEYQRDFIKGYLDVADARDFIIGMHVWNFADFKTGQGIMRVAGLNHKGVFTRDRKPKMAAHLLRERWQD
ncbi:MAG: beta-glucuronidase [Trueperaceae bacterium]|nr:beta-glucuronidase [Trueperaceae bacterium]